MGKKIPPDWVELGDEQVGRRRWRLGEVEFDEVSRELRLRGERVAIEPKPLDCLMALLRRPNDMVSKQELCRWVWSGRAVSESVLTKSIAKLRVAIEDEDQHLIKTVHGYGYRLMVTPVELEPENAQMQLKARQLLPKHPEIRLLRRLDEASNLWSAELTANQAPRVLCATLQASQLPLMRRELQFCRRLTEHPATSAYALPMREWHLEQPPFFLCREPLLGQLLPDWLAQNQRLASSRSDERVAWLSELCDAVACVHEAGLHFEGGLKPDCFVVVEISGQPRRLQLNLGLVPTWLAPVRTQAIVAERYRAPELLEGLQAGAAADVYALGVLGYHLLSNKWSAALAPGWESLLADPLLVSLLARATHQNSAQRLPSAQAFAQLLRELPQTRAAEQQVRRAQIEQQAQAQAAVAAAAYSPPPARRRYWQVAALIGLIGCISLLAHSLRLGWLRAGAEREREESEAVGRFWGEDLLAGTDPYQSPGTQQNLAALLDRAASRLGTRFANSPAIRVRLAETLSRSYARLGLYDKALSVSAENLQLASRSLGETSPQSAKAAAHYASLLVESDHPAQARPVLDALLKTSVYLPAPVRRSIQHACLLTQAQAEADLGQYAQALKLLQEAQKALGHPEKPADHDQHASVQAALANAHMGLGQWREAEVVLRSALGWFDRGRSQDAAAHVAASVTAFELYLQQERWAEADAAYERLQNFAHSLPDQQRMAVLANFHRAGQLLAQQKPSEALPLAQEVYERRQHVLGANHSQSLAAAALLIRAHIALGHWPQALELAAAAQQRATAALGERHPQSLMLSAVLVQALTGNQRPAEAMPLASHLKDIARQTLPPANNLLLGLLTLHGDTLAASDSKAARLEWQTVLKAAEAQFPARHTLLAGLKQRLAEADARKLPVARVGELLSFP